LGSLPIAQSDDGDDKDGWLKFLAKQTTFSVLGTMPLIQAEYGDGYMDDISAAQAFIRDLEVIAPGTIASLERTGAGNDPRLVRSAIKEARRRGYRG
jgi:hypothetical protein